MMADLRSYRAFCEYGDCLWSSPSCDTPETAQGMLEDHADVNHPDCPVVGTIDQTL